MARFHPRRVPAAALVLVLFLGGVPSWATAKDKPRAAAPPRVTRQQEMVRIFDLLLGHVSLKTESTDPNGGSGSTPPSAPGGATPDIGSSLNPFG
jgi:hypothetical protein